MSVALLCPPRAWSVPRQPSGPTDILRKEHGIIRKVFAEAGESARRIRGSGAVDAERIGNLHDFFTNFADRPHHAEEERERFPAKNWRDIRRNMRGSNSGNFTAV